MTTVLDLKQTDKLLLVCSTSLQNPKKLCSLLTGVLECLSTSSADRSVQLHSFGAEEWSTRSDSLCHFFGLTVLCSNKVRKFYLPLYFVKDRLVNQQ